jgi:hypothetical protein
MAAFRNLGSDGLRFAAELAEVRLEAQAVDCFEPSRG